MVQLVVCIGEGKGTWGHVSRVISEIEWSDVFVITTDYFIDKFKAEKKFTNIVLDKDKDIDVLVGDVQKQLDGKLRGDVAVNFLSGSGKEHMALLSALLKLGAGIRLVAVTKEGVREL